MEVKYLKYVVLLPKRIEFANSLKYLKNNFDYVLKPSIEEIPEIRDCVILNHGISSLETFRKVFEKIKGKILLLNSPFSVHNAGKSSAITFNLLETYGIPTFNDPFTAIKKYGIPIVAKNKNSWGGGKGVKIINSYLDIPIKNMRDYIFQPYILDIEHEYRTIFVGDRIIQTYRRNPPNEIDEYTSIGGEDKEFDFTGFAKKIRAHYPLDVIAIDLIKTKSGKVMFLECNTAFTVGSISSPRLRRAIEKYAKENEEMLYNQAQEVWRAISQ